MFCYGVTDIKYNPILYKSYLILFLQGGLSIMVKFNASTSVSAENAVEKFEKIKEAIKGIYDILKIIIPSENDIYFKMAIDNIGVLYQNMLDLISNDNATKHLSKKMESSELIAELPLGNLRLGNNK